MPRASRVPRASAIDLIFLLFANPRSVWVRWWTRCAGPKLGPRARGREGGRDHFREVVPGKQQSFTTG